MICLCCGKPIKNEEAASCGWHHSCIKHFFGTVRLPEITISNEALEWIANETISKGYTVPGVQKKLSLHLSKEEKARLTLVGYPSGYILKPQTNEYRALPEAEQMIMCMAPYRMDSSNQMVHMLILRSVLTAWCCQINQFDC